MEVKEKPLVSVLVPCFNMEKRISRFLDSLFRQTYRELEVIFVDDGSTDGTAGLIKEFIKNYELSGGVCWYIYQENEGLGAAVNTGLKHVHGQYLIWPDPDDWLADDSIEKRVEFLERHKEYAVVTSNAYMYHEYNLEKPFRKLIKKADACTRDENQFEHMINYKSIFCPGCHMVRMSAFDDVNPEHEIYKKRNAQNFQLLLPLYYKYKRYYMDEALYHYVVYLNSMSRVCPSIDKRVEYRKNADEVLEETLKNMDVPEAELNQYFSVIRENQVCANMVMAVKMGDRAYARREYLKIENRSLKIKFFFYGLSNPCGVVLIKILRYLKTKYESIRVKRVNAL